MNYLVVDDAATMRRIIINSLAIIGFNSITEAQDGHEALMKMSDPDNKIDFIITDWNMPIMDGVTFTKAVRSDPKWAKTPILMVTTRGDKCDIVTAIQAKIDNYVVKPFTPAVLKQKIDSVKEKYGIKI